MTTVANRPFKLGESSKNVANISVELVEKGRRLPSVNEVDGKQVFLRRGCGYRLVYYNTRVLNVNFESFVVAAENGILGILGTIRRHGNTFSSDL
jgi:hypothetical protein